MMKRECPVCGSAVDASMKFCMSCGTSLEAPPDHMDASLASSVPMSAVCQRCGAPATSANQKFCALCGGKIEGSAADVHPASASPAAAVTSSASAVSPSSAFQSTATAASESAGKDSIAQARSRFDDFMGASVDVSKVGFDFRAQDIVLSEDDPRLVEAFAFFNKVYIKPSGTSSEEAGETLAPRADAEAARPQEKERRDFSARKGGFAHGELMTKLHPSAAPRVQMIGDMRGKALEQQNKGREKRKAALEAR